MSPHSPDDNVSYNNKYAALKKKCTVIVAEEHGFL